MEINLYITTILHIFEMVYILFNIQIIIVDEIKYLGHPRREALLMQPTKFN